LIGNTIEAGADIGAMAAAINLFVPVPLPWIVVATTSAILALQVWGSYTLIRNIFRWLALVLLAYIGSAVLAQPDWPAVIRGTFIPTIQFTQEFLSLLVAVIGTTLSAYLYTWQSNQEVEEEIAKGRTRLEQRKGATDEELRQTRWDVVTGMFFSNLVMYFIILSTASTLYRTGKTDIENAAQAAEALRPLAGDAASVLFAAGIIAVGFLAVPIMTTGAAYDLCQVFGWKHGLHAKPAKAKKFYLTITAFTVMAMCMNFFGFNPMKALVFAGVIQGFSTPPLLLLIMLMTNSRAVMGHRTNSLWVNVLGWTTTAAVFSATFGLVYTWFV
jgi:Mn2+/Fe2+ NRAMP family transporter